MGGILSTLVCTIRPNMGIWFLAHNSATHRTPIVHTLGFEHFKVILQNWTKNGPNMGMVDYEDVRLSHSSMKNYRIYGQISGISSKARWK